MTASPVRPHPALDPAKFRDPDVTADGAARALVALSSLETLWLNTGTLCNITCARCYIESSPLNDRLAYLTAAEAATFYDEIGRLGLGTAEIGFTGGEPFLNPNTIAMCADALARGFRALVLTNAMQPMQRGAVREPLAGLIAAHADRLTLRVSLDHYDPARHDGSRVPGSFASAAAGVDWLVERGARIAIAGRTMWDEPEHSLRAGFAALFAARGWPVDAGDPASLVLFPEMDATFDVPEITTACWGVLGLSPQSMMCATSRMVVRRRGASAPVVVPCTLLPYDPAFEMGATLAESLSADSGMFADGAVKLCHPHCARFCVLGGGSCAPA